MHRRLAIIASTVFFAAASANGANILFTPLGTVKKITQATARFSSAMVPMGDPRALAPFDVKCTAPGVGRWIDARNWAYDFQKELEGGNTCTFSLRPNLTDVAGKAVVGQGPFSFDTGGPNVVSTGPYQGTNGIAEDQAFFLVLDAPVNESSVSDKAHFVIDGVGEKVPVRVLDTKTRDAVGAVQYESSSKERWLLIAPRRTFPNGAKVELVWGQGILGKHGVATHSEQRFEYVVRGPFRAEMKCERENAEAPCSPLGSVSVSFSEAVSAVDARKVVLEDVTSGKKFTGDVSKDAEQVSYVSFPAPFPPNAQLRATVPPSLRDENDRPLENAASFPLVFPTADYPPLAKFAATFGIVEAGKDAALAVTVRHLEPQVLGKRYEAKDSAGKSVDRIAYGSADGKKFRVEPKNRNEFLRWLKRLEMVERGNSVFQPMQGDSVGPVPLPKAAASFALPKKESPEKTEVVGIPLSKNGLHIVEIESARLGASLLGTAQAMPVAAGALVTNLAVHFKRGGDLGNSIAWVTSLHSGKPVGGAEVEVRDCANQVLWSGKSDKDGIARIANVPEEEANCVSDDRYSRYGRGLLVLATKGDDTSFVHTSWEDGIEPWRFHLTAGVSQESSLRHTIFDRPLYRAGDAVHMKHFLRKVVGDATVVPKERHPFLLIRHLGSDQKYRFPLTWDAAGTAISDWSIPKDAKLGMYEVGYAKTEKDEWGERSGTIRVEEYRVPLLRATLDGPKETPIATSSISVDASLSYLSGGPAGNLPVKLRTLPQGRRSLTYSRFPGYAFAEGSVKEGREKNPDSAKPTPVKTTPAKLDASGTMRFSASDIPRDDAHQSVLAELEFADPNGEVQTVSRAFSVFPASHLPAVKFDGWVQRQESLHISVAVADTAGAPVANAPVVATMFRRKTTSHRKRLIGGFYAYEHETVVEKAGELCRGKTDAQGLLSCEGKASETGSLTVEVSTTDSEGRRAASNSDVYVTGNDAWFTVGDGDRIDVIPLEPKVEPGGTARVQVRMPFRSATVLVTTEREGVLDAFVRELSGKDPVVDVPIRAEHSPNVFIGVFAVRGRIGEDKATALVDLSRPAFKIGMTEIDVGWKPHSLKVSVEPEKPVYRVRDKATVRLKVVTEDGRPLPAGAELAVAAIDEGLLELAPATSWDLLQAMMAPRSLSVRTATAVSQVIGKRHFGLKAMPSGGGGGNENTRELFDTLLFWNARVPVAADGTATVLIPLNDSLTGFRIAAIASAGADRFGTGQGKIRTSQPLMLLSGISPLARNGDRIGVSATVRNGSEQPFTAAVKMSAKGKAVGATQTAPLAAGEAKTLRWDYDVPSDVAEVKYEIVATAEGAGGKFSDKMKITQVVRDSAPERVYQATIARLDGTFSVPVERPADAAPNRGGVKTSLEASLLGSLEPVRRYMSEYPYPCLEQKVSRAIATSDKKLWDKTTKEMPAYSDGSGLLKFFPSSRQGDAMLTAYVLSVAAEAGWAIPKSVEKQAQSALVAFAEGKLTQDTFWTGADLSLRKMSALEALSRTKARHAEVKRILSSIAIDVPLWPSAALLDYWNVLRRTRKDGTADPAARKVQEQLRARLNMQGTSLSFTNEASESLPWLLISGDVVANRLLLDLVDDPQFAAAGEDVGRLARGTVSRQKHGHWDLTTANAWGVLALGKFGRKFESQKVEGTTKVSFDRASAELQWATAGKKGAKLERLFPWPEKRANLEVNHTGGGAPWLLLQTIASIHLKAPLSAGFSVEKSVEGTEVKRKGRWTVGDIVRVRLKVRTDADRTWVVVDDPIPAGASIISAPGVGAMDRDSVLAGAGGSEAKDEESSGAWLAFGERSFTGFRGFYEYAPQGQWVVEYRMRLNTPGTLHLPTTRIEAMYQPETFAELPNADWVVEP